jgi:hypothetical protein
MIPTLPSLRSLFPGFAAFLLAGVSAAAQWLTQPVDLRPGWNAVQLHVDPSHVTLDTLIGGNPSNPIQEIWLWTPAVGSAQFVQSPQVPTSTISQWSSWKRPLGAGSEFNRLYGNAVCLVKVGDVGTNYTFRVLGRPVPPKHDWTATGLNFLGLPVPAGAGVAVDQFFQPGGDILRALEIYRYGPGDLDSGNPSRVFALRSTNLRRGEAYWMRAGDTFNRYFGPLEVVLQDPRGVVFGARFGEHRLRLRNRSTSSVTIRMDLLASEAAPTNQAPVAGLPSLLIRGDLNPTNLLFPHTVVSLTNGGSWTLAAAGQSGSELEVVLGLDRYSMGGQPGDVFAGILRFSDSLGLTQTDLPVSAEVGSWSGLWIGDAQVRAVRNPVMNEMGPVPQPYPVRLLVHVQGTNAVLLQRVFLGLDAGTNRVVATRESALAPGALSGARRLSSVSFPWTETNAPWALDGAFVHDGTVSTTVVLAHDDHRSNPFLHSFHPDHDNLDATYTQTLPAGRESWSVTRAVRLRIRPPGSDFKSLTVSADRVDGVYEETLTFQGRPADSKSYDVSGDFFLRRISDVPVLTRN